MCRPLLGSSLVLYGWHRPPPPPPPLPSPLPPGRPPPRMLAEVEIPQVVGKVTGFRRVMLSRSRGVLFVPVPKVASSTIKRVLARQGFEEISLREAVEEQLARELFTFTVVRDPITRFLSGYAELSYRLEVGLIEARGQAWESASPGVERLGLFIEAVEDGFKNVHIQSQCSLLKGLRYHGLGRVEFLALDLRRLGASGAFDLAEKLPRLRRRSARRERYLSPDWLAEADLGVDTIRRLSALYRDDLDLYAEANRFQRRSSKA